MLRFDDCNVQEVSEVLYKINPSIAKQYDSAEKFAQEMRFIADYRFNQYDGDINYLRTYGFVVTFFKINFGEDYGSHKVLFSIDPSTLSNYLESLETRKAA